MGRFAAAVFDTFFLFLKYSKRIIFFWIDLIYCIIYKVTNKEVAGVSYFFTYALVNSEYEATVNVCMYLVANLSSARVEKHTPIVKITNE